MEESSFSFDLSHCPRKTGLFSFDVTFANDDHVARGGDGVTAYRRFIVEP